MNTNHIISITPKEFIYPLISHTWPPLCHLCSTSSDEYFKMPCCHTY